MKQFIVLAAVLPIMLVFVMQFVCDQSTNRKIDAVQSVVYAAKEEAKQAGCFTDDIVSCLKRDAAAAAGVTESEVEVITDGVVKYRYGSGSDRLIYYTVKVPIRGVMAGASMFGIDDGENGYVYVIDSYTASEKV